MELKNKRWEVNFPNFKREEFTCSCCSNEGIKDSFMFSIQELRDRCHIPMLINSGYRCLKHNTDIGSKPTSRHVQGIAADVSNRAMTSTQKHIFLSRALELFNGVGIYPTFFHIDKRSYSQRAVWVSS